ncbi:hypothetical protein [Plantibacter sp. T3]|uniref:hypothetical protein n=1 Tax=Plantibacter sp. T3 TaxID=2653161 RepID=UPI0012F06921|nr:hypothetical protein [Plantibacter sp. T3]VXC20194.1 conserved hypothetical protein [Plantibacter sp. T3]
MIGFGAEPDGVICSRAGCRAAASWRIEWRNPKIHAVDRVKVWTACDEHVDFLEAFLEARSFPLERRPLASAVGS